MSQSKPSIKTKLHEYLQRTGPEVINEKDWEIIKKQFAEASTGYLRRLLRDSNIALAPLVEGVRQESFEALERSLLALGSEYQLARDNGDHRQQQCCRDLVIEAKDHARWAATRASDEEKKAQKREMADWMRVWLEDPATFPPWLRLRKRATRERQ